jgi:hypothetical protein
VHPLAILAPKPTKKPAMMKPIMDKSPTNLEVLSKKIGESTVFGGTIGSKKHFIKEDMKIIPIMKEKL